MSKKQQYTTKFYEDNGGGIQAVTRDENGKVVNVLDGFEADSGTGLSVLAAARKTGHMQTHSSLTSGAERLWKK